MSGFDDLFGPMLGGGDSARRVAEQNEKLRKQRAAQSRNATPVPPIRGKSIDGVKYLNAQDVADALKAVDHAARVRVVIQKYLDKS